MAVQTPYSSRSAVMLMSITAERDELRLWRTAHGVCLLLWLSSLAMAQMPATPDSPMDNPFGDQNPGSLSTAGHAGSARASPLPFADGPANRGRAGSAAMPGADHAGRSALCRRPQDAGRQSLRGLSEALLREHLSAADGRQRFRLVRRGTDERLGPALSHERRPAGHHAGHCHALARWAGQPRHSRPTARRLHRVPLAAEDRRTLPGRRGRAAGLTTATGTAARPGPFGFWATFPASTTGRRRFNSCSGPRTSIAPTSKCCRSPGSSGSRMRTRSIGWCFRRRRSRGASATIATWHGHDTMADPAARERPSTGSTLPASLAAAPGPSATATARAT